MPVPRASESSRSSHKAGPARSTQFTYISTQGLVHGPPSPLQAFRASSSWTLWTSVSMISPPRRPSPSSVVSSMPSIKFFITGRPEPRIRTGFCLFLLELFTQIFLPHEVKFSSVDEDVRLYFQKKLAVVAKQRSDLDLPYPWPLDKDLTSVSDSSLPRQTALFVRDVYTQVLVHAFSNTKEITMFENLTGCSYPGVQPIVMDADCKILNISAPLISKTLHHLHLVLILIDSSEEICFPQTIQRLPVRPRPLYQCWVLH